MKQSKLIQINSISLKCASGHVDCSIHKPVDIFLQKIRTYLASILLPKEKQSSEIFFWKRLSWT